jgi:hypothetical protein
MLRCSFILFLCFIAAAPAAPMDAHDFFESKIRPVLVEQCFSCHSAKDKKLRGGLALDSRAAILKGGDNGPALVPGHPEKSLLLKAMHHNGDLKMPPKGKLSAAVLADFEKWIRDGAQAPQGAEVAVKGIDWATARKFWSYQKVKRPELPSVKDSTQLFNAVDRFVLAKLQNEHLSPVPQADKRTLLRRLSFDLTGLPPTPEELAAFLADARPDAFSRAVDRLLASPAYGERWARHWLDVARYAEDQAHTFGVKPNSNAWRYRDWVVEALKQDMPYDRFVKLQIAADLMSDAEVGDRAALGFFGLGAQYYKNTDAARAAADELDDRVDTLTRGFLGLTVSCARCHDHKYDPIPTIDYYSLAGIFRSSKLDNLFLASKEQTEQLLAFNKKLNDAETAHRNTLLTAKKDIAAERLAKLPDYLRAAREIHLSKAKLDDVAKTQSLDVATLRRCVEILATGEKVAGKLTGLEIWRNAETSPKNLTTHSERLMKQLVEMSVLEEKAIRNQDKPLFRAFLAKGAPFAMSDAELAAAIPAAKKSEIETLKSKVDTLTREKPATPPMVHGLSEASAGDMKVFIRGNPATQGPIAPRRFLRILSDEEPSKFTKGSGRLELANAIASPENPLTARVIVNRLWLHHFGSGLVGTPSNFGELGERPTHPELLDYLADELVQSGWSLKHIHRLILNSATWQRASVKHAANHEKDPDNKSLWRQNRRRLDIESWRDSLLAASGQLQRIEGGPTLDLSANNNQRRTLYARISRHELNGLLRLFDFPDANITAEKRTETTVPQQQLFVLNSPFIIAQAKALAARVAREPEDQRLPRLMEYALSRAPSEGEKQLFTAYLNGKDEADEMGKNQLSRLERLAQVLLAGNEFLYID